VAGSREVLVAGSREVLVAGSREVLGMRATAEPVAGSRAVLRARVREESQTGHASRVVDHGPSSPLDRYNL